MSAQNVTNSNHLEELNGEENHPPRKKSRIFTPPTPRTSNKNCKSGPSTSPYFQHNAQNSQDVDIETAYKQRNYELVLKLLLKDQEFPEDFYFRGLDNSFPGCKELRKFVIDRNKLHKFIIKNDLEEVKRILPQNEGKLYLNCKNQSALHAALTKNSFETFSYLLSMDAQFKDASERKALTKLENENKRKLQAAISNIASSVKNKVNKYLLSKTTFLGNDVSKILISYYKELMKVEEISVMLEVLQFRDIQILFDFYRMEVDHVAPASATDREVGLSKFKEGKIYIAAHPKRTKEKILGTIAHEFTHMAMQIVFENETNPYKSDDKENEKKFQDVLLKVKNLDRNCFSAKRNAEGVRIETLYNKFFNTYQKKNVQPSELIVTIPQILAENGNDKRWLSKNVPYLLDFYNEIVLKCKEFIENGRDYLYKSTIENFNKYEGEIDRLKSLEIHFKHLNGFLESCNERAIVVETGNSTLTMLRVLQKFYGNDFISRQENFLVLKFSKLIKKNEFFYDCVRSNMVKTLVIEFDVSEENKFYEGADILLDLSKESPSLKYVIVTSKTEEILRNALKRIKLKTSLIKQDKNYLLNDLDDASVDNVLNKTIFFQEEEIKLNEIIAKDEGLFRSINLETVGKLCCEEKVKIGGTVVGTSSLEGAYADVIDDMDLNRFCNKINSKDDFIFIISGLHGKKKEKQLFDTLKSQSKAVKFDNNLCEECIIPKTYAKKKIILTDSELSNKSFKEFCCLNPRKKIYLIKLLYKYEDPKPTFLLKRYYNPDFYTERKFREKVIKTARSTLIKQCEGEHFIISHSKSKTKLPNTQYLEGKEAEKAFEELSRNGVTVHWLFAEDKYLIWIKSSGSMKNIIKYITKSQKLYNEDRLIRQIENQKVVLFADDPGMGKSTSVTKLYEKKINYLSLCQKNWVIRINLREHSDIIQTIETESFDNHKLIAFLSEIDQVLKKDVNLTFLRLAISSDKFLKPLLIVMDGYDELSNENHREKIKFLMRYLKNKTCCKIWVTTRFNFKEELENELCMVSIEFDSINEAKNKFITNYFKHRLDLVVKKWQIDERLKAYVQHFINNLKITFKDSEKFIGTPLQLYLMLENSIDGCRNFIEDPKLVSPDFSGLGNDLLDIYNKFLIMKYDVYFKKLSLQSVNKLFLEISCDFFNSYNKNLVDSLMFKTDFKEFLEKYKPLMLETGIVKAGDGDLEFIHLTFKEYFSSEVITEYLKGKRERKLDFNLIYILITEIFLKQDHQLVRNFLNLHLGKINVEELPNDNLKSIGQVMAIIYGGNSSGKDKNGTVLHVAVKEKNKSIFNFLIDCCKQAFTNEQFRNFLITVNSCFITVFHVAVSTGDKSFCESVISKIVSLNLSDDIFSELLNFKYKTLPKYSTPLELAKKKNCTEIAQYIERLLPNVDQISD